MKKKLKNVIVLHSGGIDSTALIHFYKTLNYTVNALYIDFGQMSNRKEWSAVKKVGSYYDIAIKKIDVRAGRLFTGGFIQGRNLFLVSTALLAGDIQKGQIALGIHSGTNYIDCSKEFLDRCNELFTFYSGGKIVVSAPFVDWNKKEIFDYCKQEKIPIQLTYSCELGKKQPCEECSSCKELIALYATQNY